jgi:adenylate kinase
LKKLRQISEQKSKAFNFFRVNYRTAIFFGKQGSGKGTQAARLEEALSKTGEVFHFQTGHAFRDLANENSYTGELVHHTLPGGQIQPLFMAVWLWADAFVKHLKGNEHVIADGFPRRVTEAQILTAAFEFYGRDSVDVINLSIPNDVALERMLARGRSDDTEQAIRERLEWHDREATPVIDYFRELRRYEVHDIDATRPVDDVANDILKIFGLA